MVNFRVLEGVVNTVQILMMTATQTVEPKTRTPLLSFKPAFKFDLRAHDRLSMFV